MRHRHIELLLVESSTKIEIQLQNTSIERTPKPSPMTILPRMPYDPESDIFIWRTRCEYDELGIVVSGYTLDMICGSFGLVASMSADLKEYYRESTYMRSG